MAGDRNEKDDEQTLGVGIDRAVDEELSALLFGLPKGRVEPEPEPEPKPEPETETEPVPVPGPGPVATVSTLDWDFDIDVDEASPPPMPAAGAPVLAPKEPELPVSGQLADGEVARLLEDLGRGAFDGVLSVKQGAVEKRLYFLEGELAFAASNQPHDSLGELLVREGKVTRPQLDEARRIAIEHGRRTGAVLVDLGLVRPSDLFGLVRRQMTEIVFSLFAWTAGEYACERGGRLTEAQKVRIGQPLDTLVGEGLRRVGGTPSERSDRERILGRHALVVEGDYFRLLGVGRDADDLEIERAYEKALSEFHPERFPATLAHELERQLVEIADLLGEAHRVLADRGLREAYRAHLREEVKS